MAHLMQVCDVVRDRLLAGLPEWNHFRSEPNPIPVPALCVKPAVDYADYQQQLGSSYTRWSLIVALYVNATSREAADLRMAELTAPKGPIVARLRDVEGDIVDEMSRICSRDVEVTKGRGWRYQQRLGAKFLYTETGVIVGSV